MREGKSAPRVVEDIDRLIQNLSIVRIEGMNSRLFERVVARICGKYLGLAFNVGPGSKDGGVDGQARTGRGRLLVLQCKRYNSKNKVGVNEVKQFIGSMVKLDAVAGIFVTTSDLQRPEANSPAPDCHYWTAPI